MDRLALVFLVLVFTSLGWGVEFFGGLTELMNYESSLPCEAENRNQCFATNGLMGLTLDTASQAGLNISSVLIKENKSIFVKTKKYGTCLVDTKNSTDKKNVIFHCSQKGLSKNKLQKINKVFTLNKKSENQFVLKDVTSSYSVKRKL